MRRIYTAVIALLLFGTPAYGAAPTVRIAPNAALGSTGGCSMGAWTGETNGDLGVVICETRSEEAITGATGTWLYPVESHTAATGTSGSRTSIMAKVVDNNTLTNLSTADAGDHCVCELIIITLNTYEPTFIWQVSSTDIRETGSTSISIPGASTSHTDCLVFIAWGVEFDVASERTGQCSAWTNSDLTSVTERGDEGTNAGDGGTICMATGTIVGPGTYGATTGTAAVSGVGGEVTLAICAPYTSHRIMSIVRQNKNHPIEKQLAKFRRPAPFLITDLVLP